MSVLQTDQNDNGPADLLVERDTRDPWYALPHLWACWTDSWTVELGAPLMAGESIPDTPPAPEPAPDPDDFEPSPEDEAHYREWCRAQDQRNQDLEDMHRDAEYREQLERSARFTDEDLLAAGLIPG
jgi:hypothetical protein